MIDGVDVVDSLESVHIIVPTQRATILAVDWSEAIGSRLGARIEGWLIDGVQREEPVVDRNMLIKVKRTGATQTL